MIGVLGCLCAGSAGKPRKLLHLRRMAELLEKIYAEQYGRTGVTARMKEGPRKIYRTVGYGSSFGGNSQRQHGVGNATQIEGIEIDRPVSKSVQKFRDVPVDKFLHVKEGKRQLDPIDLKPFAFRPIPEGLHHHGPWKLIYDAVKNTGDLLHFIAKLSEFVGQNRLHPIRECSLRIMVDFDQ